NQNNMERMEQEVSDLISLSDSEPESKEYLEVSQHSLTETIYKQKQKLSTQSNIRQMFQKMVATDPKRKATSLITILRPFAEATELLGGSKYATISFMYSTIIVIKQKLLTYNNNLNIDFDFSCNVFDDDVVYEGNEELEENYESSKKR
ncbi:2381_t:CDS:2, partial [Scutellospora calospora]